VSGGIFRSRSVVTLDENSSVPEGMSTTLELEFEPEVDAVWYDLGRPQNE
jgi:hypothetical protein